MGSSNMLRKKEAFTICTPIPGFIPRQLALDILHSHSEVITLNPLVLDHHPVSPPRDADADEFYSTWYEITERIQYIPGLGRMGSGKISFKGCFHNMPWGLQTHVYAPMNVDLRIKYRIEGNQKGVEPPQRLEIGLAGLGAPSDGLYLREDIEFKCTVALAGFVRSQLKSAIQQMVDRMIKKAELLDSGVLQGMLENGKLKTINPADRTQTLRSPQLSPALPPSASPVSQHLSYMSSKSGPHSPTVPYNVPRPTSTVPPGTYGGYAAAPPAGQQPQAAYAPQATHMVAELPTESPNQGFVMELPGDFYYAGQQPPEPRQQSPQPSPGPPKPQDANTLLSRWSATDYQQSHQGSRPSSYASDTSGGIRSPPLDKGFSSDLAPHRESPEEYRVEALKRLDGSATPAGRRSYGYQLSDSNGPVH